MKIAWRFSAFMCAVILAVLAAIGKTQPSRFEYAVLWGLVALVTLSGLLDAVKERIERTYARKG